MVGDDEFASMTEPLALDVRNLKKNYGGVAALRGVDFGLRFGEVHGLCGENGAGKSTLVKILAGLVTATEGEITVTGIALKPGRRTDPRLISIVHQELSIIPDLSVLDNVLMGDSTIGEVIRHRKFAPTVRRKLDAVGLHHVDLDQYARELTLAEQQLVEIARGVSRGAKILILDEPTATLSDVEIQKVFTAVRWLRDQGTAVIFISHRLPEVFGLTDRVTVFRNGERVLTAETANLTTEQLVRAMIGREIVGRHAIGHAAEVPARRPRLSLRHFSVPGRFAPVDLTFGESEVIAVVGQLGSGADILIEAVAGLRRIYTGGIEVEGKAVEARGTRQAIRHGIAYVPEDRAGKGVFLDASVAVNISASILDRVCSFGFLRQRAGAETARRLSAMFQIDARRLTSEVSQLSGGNQQKVALAKAVALQPKILVLNEPPRGVDIGARTEIYRQLRSLAETGMVVLFFTTDIEEVHELADRVITVFRGVIVRDLPTAAASMDDVLADVLHGPRDAAVDQAA